MKDDCFQRSPSWRLLDVASLALLCSALALPYYSAELGEDAVRDLLVAEAIVRRRVFPSTGPSFHLGAFALGPIWYYVLALPCFLGTSLSLSALFVGALAALKLPLAFRWAVLAVDRRFAWCLAAAICWPGVQAFQWLWWSTPNVLETCLWGSALSLLHAFRDRSGRIRWWLGTAAFFGLAVHAHPTALLYLPVIAAFWLVWTRAVEPSQRPRIVAASALGMIASFGSWFLPAYGAILGSTDGGGPGASLSEALAAAFGRWDQVLRVSLRLFWDYPLATWHSWRAGDAWADFLLPSLVLWHALTLLGLFFAWRELVSPSQGARAQVVSRLMAGAAVVGGAGLCVVSVMRPWVAFYTAFVLVPPISILQAGGIWLVWSHCRSWYRGIPVLAIASSLIGIALLGDGAIDVNGGGLSRLPLSMLGDLARQPATESVSTVRVRQSPAASKVFAQWLCRNGVGVLHGTAALAAANARGLFHRRYCSGSSESLLLGADVDRHVVGLPTKWLELAGREPIVETDGVGLAWVRRVVNPLHGWRVPEGFFYLAELLDKRERATTLVFRFSTDEDSGVLLTSLNPWHGQTQVLAVTRNGEALEPVGRTALGAIWVAPRKGKSDGTPRRVESMEWTIAVRTDVPQWVDVVTF